MHSDHDHLIPHQLLPGHSFRHLGKQRVLCPLRYIRRYGTKSWVKVFRIIPEFRILRLTFHRKSVLKCRIREIIIGFPIYIQSV